MITAKMPVSADIVRRGLPWPVGIGVRHLADIDETSTARGTGGRDARLLYPGEEEVLGPRAVAERRQLFALGRAAARDALGELGFAPVAIGRGEGGEPLWPAGVVGSISHSRQVAVAVAGLRQDYVGLGVDVEGLSRALQPRAARLICRPSEMDWVDPENGTDRLLMVFSAKEAIFKALYPIQRVWLGFGDAELTWQPARGGFTAVVLRSVGEAFPAGLVVEVNCTVGDNWLLTTAFLPAR